MYQCYLLLGMGVVVLHGSEIEGFCYITLALLPSREYPSKQDVCSHPRFLQAMRSHTNSYSSIRLLCVLHT